MSRANRVMMIVKEMSDEERLELFDRLEGDYCENCGQELPDEDSDEPDHDCPNDPGDEGDDGLDDDEDDEEGDDDDD